MKEGGRKRREGKMRVRIRGEGGKKWREREGEKEGGRRRIKGLSKHLWEDRISSRVGKRFKTLVLGLGSNVASNTFSVPF